MQICGCEDFSGVGKEHTGRSDGRLRKEIQSQVWDFTYHLEMSALYVFTDETGDD
jgi:hypothetical protein